MKRATRNMLIAGAAAAGMLAGTVAGGGSAAAAGTGATIEATAGPDCTANFTLTNYTNSTYYQPDWWFEQENDDELVNATSIPAEAMPSPWREVNGVPWPIARWVGVPALHSEVADGVPTSPYNSSAQPEGYKSTATVSLWTAKDAPKPAQDGSMTIWYRIKTGPQTSDRQPTPQKLTVTDCRSGGNGSAGWGSSDWGSLS